MDHLRQERENASFTQTLRGVIPTDRAPLFERMIFRVSRGNAVTRFISIDEPIIDAVTGEPVRKSVYTIVFVGTELKKRLQRVGTFFGASEHEVPDNAREIQRVQRELESRLDDYRLVMETTSKEITKQLEGISYDPETNSSPWACWMSAIIKERAISDTLRRCDVGENSSMITCEGWVPTEDLEELKDRLHSAVRHSQVQQAALQIVAAPGAPPTYFKVNKFTEAFQGIVDTYGVPRYKEANPGLFTIITFPFLFGVMYGDVGHATALFLFCLYLLWNEADFMEQQRKKTMNEIFSMAFGGRYLLTLMSLFGIYAGFIYNDCFSIPLNIFGSQWSYEKGSQVAHRVEGRSIYPLGIDPSWHHTTNELAFFNSFKMKLSVTLGVIQMTFGLFLGLSNHIHFKDRLAVWFEFIPRVLFMMCTFGYMIFIIIYKMCVDWEAIGHNPPNLIQTMIQMFLAPGKVEADKELYSGQAAVQFFLLSIALLCVPVMLLAQPLIARSKHLKMYGPGGTHVHDHNSDEETEDDLFDELENNNDADEGEEKQPLRGEARIAISSKKKTKKVVHHEESHSGHGPDPTSPHYSFGDHAITSGIHTIEFVLGCVSNTASYLRLWALSLAHAQLSSVFWEKMIQQYGLDTGNTVALVVGLAVWSCATTAVLLAMDVLECFLHALRLHWVEFQSKFYSADGYPFTPYSFDAAVVE